jgi:hypothetical protein
LFLSGYAAGKSMIVQSINTGEDLPSNDMAILTPGGGIGNSSATGCTKQYGNTWYVISTCVCTDTLMKSLR